MYMNCRVQYYNKLYQCHILMRSIEHKVGRQVARAQYFRLEPFHIGPYYVCSIDLINELDSLYR